MQSVKVNIPLAPVKSCEVPFHLNCHLIDKGQALALARLTAALDSSGARTKNGRRVVTANIAIKWLLELIEGVSLAE